MDNTNVIGQSEEVERAVDYRPALAGAGPEVTVEIFNPLSMDFSVKFAVSVASAPVLSPDQRDFQKRMADFGIPLTKQGNSMAHAVKYTILPAGKTIKLPGHVAQVAVRQLVTEILQRRGLRNKVADPHSRQEIEQEVIYNYAAFAQVAQSDEDAVDRQIRELNDPATQLTVSAKEETNGFDPIPNPPPGQGVRYEPAKPAETSQETAGVPGESGEPDSPSPERTRKSQ